MLSSRNMMRLALVSALMLSTCLTGSVASADLEGFDIEDDIPVASHTYKDADSDFAHEETRGGDAGDEVHEEFSEEQRAAAKIASAASRPKPLAPVLDPEQWVTESLLILSLLLFALNLIFGARLNADRVKAWGDAYTGPGSLMERNFSLLGPGNTQDYFIRENSATVKFYASGRRHCQNLLVTLSMVNRQDLLSIIYGLMDPSEDQVIMEVRMNESSMPQMCLAVANRKFAAIMQRDVTDIQRFAKKLTIDKNLMPNWPHDKIQVLAEQAAHFYDLFSDPKVHMLFNANSAHGPNVLRHFRSMHITSDAVEGHKYMIRFVFGMPSADKMAELDKCMEMVLLFVDLVGCYKPSAEMKKKAVELRATVKEDDDEKKRERLEALQRKKEEKMKEEKARVTRMSPMERERYDAAQAKKAMKKMNKTGVKRI